MPRAWCLVREQPHYRREAFVAGLAAAGYTLKLGEPGQDIVLDDILVIWNRYSHYESHANAFERRGGRVVVAENGYLGDDENGRQHYALAVGAHNGGGTWHVGGPERWAALGIPLLPWRTAGTHILVCPQRGIGPKNYAQHPAWPQDLCERLKQATRRPVRIRQHPGNKPAETPLAADLEDCWAMVTWASNAGTHALLAGIPVFYEGPYWIMAPAGQRDISKIDAPDYPDRLAAFERLAWAQWKVDEIASGEAFRTLLHVPGSGFRVPGV